jgi:PAS domain S-box-containing protein
MSQGIQQPLFASASAQGQGDDFDLNEIFAEYFISEFENPVNAYTNAMGNYVAGPGPAPANTAPAPTTFAPAPTTVQHMQQPGVSSGIRTPYHSAVAAPALPAVQPQHQQVQSIGLPLAKRAKLDHGITKPTTMTANVAATGGVTSRLGFNTGHLQGGAQGGTALQMGGGRSGILPAGVPGSMTLAQQQQQQGSFAQHQQQGTGVALPVGRGIRLGGAGGVAPATAQKVPGVGGMIWGGPQMMGMSDQAVAERRQRNREHAKRSRVRKKFMLESLQEQVASLQRENQRLRMLVQDNIPEHAQMIISECCTSSPLFGDIDGGQPGIGEDETGEGKNKTTALVRSDFQLIDSLAAGQQNFVLSDPRLPDNPIVFATPGFYRLTGYTPEQVLGRNCRFLQGSGTDPKSVDIVRKAIQSGSDCTVCILNYKADGTPFWNQFFVAALRDSDNCIVNYVGVQTEIEPDAGANALEDRVNAVMPLANKEDEEEE